MSGFATGPRRTYVSQATPATYLLLPQPAEVETTGEIEVPYYEPPVSVPPLTDLEFIEWLQDESAIRTIEGTARQMGLTVE